MVLKIKKQNIVKAFCGLLHSISLHILTYFKVALSPEQFRLDKAGKKSASTVKKLRLVFNKVKCKLFSRGKTRHK